MSALGEIRAAFSGFAVAVADESALSAFVRRRLDTASIEARAEVPLDGNKRNRIDFVVDRVGIELKTKGGWAEVLRQLSRYALASELDAIVLITTRRSLCRGLPAELNGKPLIAIPVGAL